MAEYSRDYSRGHTSYCSDSVCVCGSPKYDKRLTEHWKPSEKIKKRVDEMQDDEMQDDEMQDTDHYISNTDHYIIAILEYLDDLLTDKS